MKESYNHLTLTERRHIYYWHHYDKLSNREIGKRLRRSHTTIGRELKRNIGCWCDQYYHNPAQYFTSRRQRDKSVKERLKSQRTRDYVSEHLKLGWSPEIIAGRLKLQNEIPRVSYEAIYQYIYKEATDLIEFLPRKHKKRKKKYPNRKNKVPISHKVSILDRPEHINNRLEIGHWESDSIESKCRKKALNVVVERATRLVHICKLASKKSIDTNNAIIKRLSIHLGHIVKSITYDNGPENAKHLKANEELSCKSYFCQPYHSWEKGAVEQVNGLIRRYIPKGTDLSKVHYKTIEKIERLLNNRPRRCLGFKTPQEVYNQMSGALSP